MVWHGGPNPLGFTFENINRFPVTSDVVVGAEWSAEASVTDPSDAVTYLKDVAPILYVTLTARYRAVSFGQDGIEATWWESLAEANCRLGPEAPEKLIISGLGEKRVGVRVDGPLWPVG